jgi:hypothetical protein
VLGTTTNSYDSAMAFDTVITTDGDTITGPTRQPRQMLADQAYDGHASVHDGDVAQDLGLPGAPIEGPTHFSQFDPLAFSLWGQRWFEGGCISAHFQTMVVEGESVTASLTRSAEPDIARIDAVKPDGTPVLTGTVSVDPSATTELAERLAKMQARDPGDLFIIDRLAVGQRSRVETPVSIDMNTDNGMLYPFSLRRKLDGITEPSPWYDTVDNPWGRPIVPFEMFSVLANKVGSALAVRGPAVGLFIDLEVRVLDGPLFVDEEYVLDRQVLAVGQSRRVESHWVETRISSVATGAHVATVLLHSGSFKASYAAYPADRL